MESRRRVSIVRIVVLLVLGAALWWFLFKPAGKLHDEKAEPRAVVARGDLAQDEKTAIEIFRNVSHSVVYITSLELHRDFFSLNIQEIPKGTGSGFIWDKDGRIVTNFHVIEDASRIEVILADNTKWKASLVADNYSRHGGDVLC
jgi:S1-C subfamily serine protease